MIKSSLFFFPNTAKKSNRNGKIPMYVRVVLKGKKSETRLNTEVTEKQLLKWNPMLMRFEEKDSHVNKLLNLIEVEYNNFITSNGLKLENFNALTLKESILNIGTKEDISLYSYVSDYYQKIVLPNPGFVKGTKKNYNKAVNHLNNFLEYSDNKRILLKDVSNSFALKFKDYLISNNDELDRVGMTEVSAAGILKKYRTIFSRAMDEELISKNPFKTLKLKNKSPRRDRLNIHQLKNLWEMDLRNSQSLDIYRDIFMFSVFTGLSYKDAADLKYQNIYPLEGRNLCIKINRVKTGMETNVVLVLHAKEIVEKFKNNVENKISGNVLPRRSNTQINLHLKVLADKAGISINLTSHIARHTFRQLLSEASIEDYGVIKKMMGQSRGGDIDEVYYSITEAKLIEAKEKFEIFLNKYINGYTN